MVRSSTLESLPSFLQVPLAGEKGITPQDFRPHQAPTAWFCMLLVNITAQAMMQEAKRAAMQGQPADWSLLRSICDAVCQGLAMQDHSIPWVCMYHAQALSQLLRMQQAMLRGRPEASLAAEATAQQLEALLSSTVELAAGRSTVGSYLQQCFPITYADISIGLAQLQCQLQQADAAQQLLLRGFQAFDAALHKVVSSGCACR
jgi:hypothetical protein